MVTRMMVIHMMVIMKWLFCLDFLRTLIKSYWCSWIQSLNYWWFLHNFFSLFIKGYLFFLLCYWLYAILPILELHFLSQILFQSVPLVHFTRMNWHDARIRRYVSVNCNHFCGSRRHWLDSSLLIAECGLFILLVELLRWLDFGPNSSGDIHFMNDNAVVLIKSLFPMI